MKMYKKRPIYWLFSSGKEKAFECLVYLHRYNEGTLSRMRTEYIVPLLARYQGNIDLVNDQLKSAESGAATTRLKKELDGLTKKFNELRNFDDRLRHYADRRIILIWMTALRLTTANLAICWRMSPLPVAHLRRFDENSGDLYAECWPIGQCGN